MNPRYPVYVPTKGRYESCLTIRALEKIHVPYKAVVEAQEYDKYVEAGVDPAKILVLPHRDQGLVVTRNWIWDHALASGTKRFWTMDDNISGFYRLNENLKTPVTSGTILYVIEEFVERYGNIPIAGMNYFMFASRKTKIPPYYRNTRVYSNMLIETDYRDPRGNPYRNEGFYNDDTDLCLRVLKDGNCTTLFNAFLIFKQTTMTVKGGMTPHYVKTGEGLENDGRYRMAKELADKHPDVTTITWKWGRWQHSVDYSPFKKNQYQLKPEAVITPGVDNFGMILQVDPLQERTKATALPELPPPPRLEVVNDYDGPLPTLSHVDELALDTETSAEKDFYKHTLSGISYYLPDGKKGYLGINHPGGGNYPVETVREWAKRELRNKRLITANAGHEVETFLRFGVDLEAQGNRMRDVFHQAALVNDHRKTVMECDTCRRTYEAGTYCDCGSESGHSLGRVNLAVLARQELGHTMIEIDHTKLCDMPVGHVAPAAVEDAEETWKLNEHFNPTIAAEGLEEVLALEDDLVYCVAEMERNGTYLDVSRLKRYKEEVEAEWYQRITTIYEATGIKDNLNGWKGMQRLFDHLRLPYGYTRGTKKKPQGTPTFPEDFLLTVEHPIVQLALETRQLSSVQSKFLDPYLARVADDGLLRYNLHQLAGDQKGAITGRFSASDVNIQQVSKNSKQPPLLQRWPIRACFLPGPGDDGWLSGDASQIEFRLFAHYAAKFGKPRLADEYRKNPWIDFHNLVVEWTGLIRDYAKNVNFCKLYGGGADKIAYMINSYRKPGAKLVTPDWVSKHVVKPYDLRFPEARWLMKKAETQAMLTGFIPTFLGRRRRFGGSGERYYSALNCVIQGGAADINKKKLLELYRNRQRLGLVMRFTLHDEVDGGLRDRAMLPAVTALLNEQTTELHVPIMWQVNVGETWHEAH